MSKTSELQDLNKTEELREYWTDRWGVSISAQGYVDGEELIHRILIDNLDGTHKIIEGDLLNSITGVVLQFCEAMGYITYADDVDGIEMD